MYIYIYIHVCIVDLQHKGELVNFEDTTLLSNTSTICVRPKQADTPSLGSYSAASTTNQNARLHNASSATSTTNQNMASVSTSPTIDVAPPPPPPPSRRIKCPVDLFLSCTPSDRRFANAVRILLARLSPHLVICLSAGEFGI